MRHLIALLVAAAAILPARAAPPVAAAADTPDAVAILDRAIDAAGGEGWRARIR